MWRIPAGFDEIERKVSADERAERAELIVVGRIRWRGEARLRQQQPHPAMYDPIPLDTVSCTSSGLIIQPGCCLVIAAVTRK